MCSNKWGYVMHILDQVHTTNCGTGDQVSTVHPRIYSCGCVDLNIPYTLTYLVLMLNFSWRYRCLHQDDQTWRKGWGFIDNCLIFLTGWYMQLTECSRTTKFNQIKNRFKHQIFLRCLVWNCLTNLQLSKLTQVSLNFISGKGLKIISGECLKIRWLDVLYWPNQ